MNTPNFDSHVNYPSNHRDVTTEDIVTVDLRPLIEMCREGEPRPKTTTIGILPEGYDPERYVSIAKRIFYTPELRVDFKTEDHFWFVTWFEQYANLEERERLKQVYPFALSGLGLYKSEQEDRMKILSIRIDRLITREPNKDYYPHTLPLPVFQLLQRITQIEDTSRKWRRLLLRRAAVLSPFFHKKHLASYELPSGEIAISFYHKRGIKRRNNVNDDITLMEKYNLLTCINHGGVVRGKVIPNQYEYNPPFLEDEYLYPLVLVSPGIMSVSYSYRCDDLVQKLYGKKQELLFIPNTWKRREESARQYRLALQKKRGESQQYWIPPTAGAREALELKMKRTIQAIQEINQNDIDREYLLDLILWLQEQINLASDEKQNEWLEVQLRTAREMLLYGLVDIFQYTKSGRIKITREGNPHRTGVYANHLNTSRKPGKHGFLPVWGAIRKAISIIIDIRSAEPLVAAINTGDRNLFDDYLKGDVYQQATERLSMPKSYQDRKALKNELWLPIQYGCGLNTTIRNLKLQGLAFSEAKTLIYDTIESYYLLKDYLKERYPKYWEGLQRLINVGRSLAHKEFYPLLPNGIPLEFDRKKPHSVPPIVMQSYVSLLTTELFNQLYELGYEPVFDIHDAVVTRKSVEFEVANTVVRNTVIDIIERHELNWQVPEETTFITIKRIEINPSLAMNQQIIEMSCIRS